MTLYSFFNGEYFYSFNTLSFQEKLSYLTIILNEALINTPISPHLKLLWELRSETCFNAQDIYLQDPKGICFLMCCSKEYIPFENSWPAQKWIPFRSHCLLLALPISTCMLAQQGSPLLRHCPAFCLAARSYLFHSHQPAARKEHNWRALAPQCACKAACSPVRSLPSAVTQWKAAPPSCTQWSDGAVASCQLLQPWLCLAKGAVGQFRL